MGVNMRAKTIPHVEYEILNWILDNIELDELREEMIQSPTAQKKKDAGIRFDKGAKALAILLQNMMTRRLHKLPEEHPDYKEKE